MLVEDHLAGQSKQVWDYRSLNDKVFSAFRLFELTRNSAVH